MSLTQLGEDELVIITNMLADLLAPRIAVALASTCRGLRAPTAIVVAELRRRCEAADAVCRKEAYGRNLHMLRLFHAVHWAGCTFTVADCTALADIIKSTSLPRLQSLYISGAGGGGAHPYMLRTHPYMRGTGFGAEGMRELAAGLDGGALPSLTRLTLNGCTIGEAGALALGAAFGRGALARLQELVLMGNGIGNSGLVALASGLRTHVHLRVLDLMSNDIGDDGVAALVRNLSGPDRLRKLDLRLNQVSSDAVKELRWGFVQW